MMRYTPSQYDYCMHALKQTPRNEFNVYIKIASAQIISVMRSRYIYI